MLPGNDNQKSQNTRRYSLFSNSNQNSKATSLPFGSIFQQTSKLNTKQLQGNSFMASSSSVCQRCRRFEVDLTNTSDDLNAIDGELKASRQVISLLQRQLELFRVEKVGLEKLIISQSENQLNKQQQQLIDIHLHSNQDGDSSQDPSLDKNQKLLLNLIREQLYAKDEEIVKLKYELKEAQNDKEQLIMQMHLLEEDNNKLKNDNSVLKENLALRDQTIVSLSNEVFEQGNSHDEFGYSNFPRRQSSAEALSSDNQQLVKAQRQIGKLIDTIDAYKKTNELLSSNVISLTERYNLAEKKEIETRSQCQELEAKCCQIQSKLLSLLKEIEQSSKQALEGDSENKRDEICNESVSLLIKRLLEDKSLEIPLSWKEGNRSNKGKPRKNNSNTTSKYECDELGFYIETYDDASHDKPTSNHSSPSRTNKRHSVNDAQSGSRLPTVEEATEVLQLDECDDIDKVNKKTIVRHLSVDSSKSDETRWHLKWDYFIKDFDKIDLNKSRDFKLLLRSGVPQEYRCKVWKALINLHIGSDRKNHGQDYYQSLLQPRKYATGSKKTLDPATKQIELDLLRTLPNNKHFETMDSSGTVRLRRVLTAYSQHNPKVGYCQGMNRLAAVALLVLPEEEAFWCLSTIVDKIMPAGYYNDLWLAQVDSSVVMDFVAIKMPNLSDHFKHYNVDLSLFAWFLTIFVDGTPPALFLRLWDSFLYEGDKILFRVALALLKMYESHLIRLNNSVSINNYLRSTVNEPMNLDQFFDIAFEWINPLSTRSLKAKRQQHLQAMKTGFGRSFMTPSPNNSDDERKYGRNDDSPYEDSSIISI